MRRSNCENSSRYLHVLILKDVPASKTALALVLYRPMLLSGVQSTRIEPLAAKKPILYHVVDWTKAIPRETAVCAVFQAGRAGTRT